MAHLSLVTFLLLLPLLAQAPAPVPDEPFWPEDPCLTARQIAARGPCLRPEDCGAFQQWTELFGMPRNTPLDPSRAARGGTLVAPPPGAERPRYQVPHMPTCLAAPSGTRR